MIWKHLLVFSTVFCLDVVWARYTKSIQEDKIFSACSFAALIYLLAGFATISFVEDHTLLFSGACGAVAGTFSALKLSHLFTIEWYRQFLRSTND